MMTLLDLSLPLYLYPYNKRTQYTKDAEHESRKLFPLQKMVVLTAYQILSRCAVDYRI
jgi:hypothetical protein